MNLEELKSAWQAYDLKLQTSQLLTEKLVVGIIRERSRSRVAQIRRENRFFFVLLVFELVILGAVFTGNPFDFTYTMQFAPFAFLAIGILMALWTVFKSQMILETDMNSTTLGAFLKKVIREYEKNKKFESWFGIIMLVSGCFTVLSFLPKKLEKMSLQAALIDTAIPIGICLLIYFLAFKLGAFKNPKSAGFKEDLQELEALSAELEQLN
ncbi:hypothetical protein [Emticicia sp. 21SJ11W-3]|uniref:hypothetical protein n=1 Tax=Emticicia sp. 21SJ11W-3 TaxID=2916755 RepID=UPI00209E3970|nr:hypothetical protein [Emticicia sp. 21SJ11W-3]UTA69017.1 hypothetical protein MB380_04235 [Emticicia sp. 21SJ11W-3]